MPLSTLFCAAAARVCRRRLHRPARLRCLPSSQCRLTSMDVATTCSVLGLSLTSPSPCSDPPNAPVALASCPPRWLPCAAALAPLRRRFGCKLGLKPKPIGPYSVVASPTATASPRMLQPPPPFPLPSSSEGGGFDHHRNHGGGGSPLGRAFG